MLRIKIACDKNHEHTMTIHEPEYKLTTNINSDCQNKIMDKALKNK